MYFGLIILGILGLFLSCYALYVEWKIHHTKKYQPVCDVTQHISCTAAFSSPYGKLLGLPNAFYGIIFYTLITLLALYSLHSFIFYLAIIACLGTLVLAYFSYYKMKNFCLVCSSIYIINFLLLIFSYRLAF